MKERKELLIIIPAYNEEKNLPQLLEKLEKPEVAEIADILVMNDASSDSTNLITKQRNIPWLHMCLIWVMGVHFSWGISMPYGGAISM